jgi:hypothetical protein
MKAGTKTAITSDKIGESTNITAMATTSSVRFAMNSGSWFTNSWTSVTSLVARAITSPVVSWS